MNVHLSRLLPFVAVILVVSVSAPAHAQSFSCPIGKDAACLDYGATVCSQFGKCVDQNAACFEPFQCDYNGFTCKSDVTDCQSEYNDLLRTHNELVSDFNALRSSSQDLVDDFDSFRRCVARAGDLAEAQFCR